LIASRECVRPGIGSCALLVSNWDVATFNVEVRRCATISPGQRPKFELPELVASLSKDSAPCPPPEFGEFLPGPCCNSASASQNPYRIYGTQATLPN
jgi:hypothetical protein